MSGERTRGSTPDRDEVRGVASEVARAAVRFLVAREEGLAPDDLPPVRSPLAAVGPANWFRIVRGSRHLLFAHLHEGWTPGDWSRLPPAVVDALGRRVALRYGRISPSRPRPLLAG